MTSRAGVVSIDSSALFCMTCKSKLAHCAGRCSHMPLLHRHGAVGCDKAKLSFPQGVNRGRLCRLAPAALGFGCRARGNGFDGKHICRRWVVARHGVVVWGNKEPPHSVQCLPADRHDRRRNARGSSGMSGRLVIRPSSR